MQDTLFPYTESFVLELSATEIIKKINKNMHA